MYDVAAIMTVMVNAPVVPAYPGSAQIRLPKKTNIAATNPPSGIPIAKQPMAASRVPADASGEQTMLPWKNPPAKSPPLFWIPRPMTSAPFTPGASGSPIHVSISTKLSQEITAAMIIPIISFMEMPPGIHLRILLNFVVEEISPACIWKK